MSFLGTSSVARTEKIAAGTNSDPASAHLGLTFENVAHRYGSRTVLAGVSVSVACGETACLLGPSGCGKTTLLRIAAGLEPLQAGRVSIGGQTVADAAGGRQVPPEARGVGLMFQDYALFPNLTILDNLVFGLARNDGARRAWVESALERFGLAEYAHKYPHTLSGGQQQRVALLRALAPEPRVMLLDEPFSGLDAMLRAQVREDTLGLLKESGVATLMVTHDPEEAMFMGDRLLILDHGRIVQSGTPLEVYLQPASAYVASLFGPLNRIEGVVHAGRVETVLGVFPAPALAEGTRAQVLVRPEALRPESNPSPSGSLSGGCVVTLAVVDARPIGRASYLRLAGAGATLLQARVPGIHRPAPGTPVAISVDPKGAFVFPI